mmetsp:Transcript_4646/g.7455  ORF Transcript_4646/g.7455 Transcript_4646/m.7455 type:complete len:194 (-) Transcript_4646:213-794(-)
MADQRFGSSRAMRVETFMPCHSMVEVPELVKQEMLCTYNAAISKDTIATAAAGDEEALLAMRFDGVCDEGRVGKLGLKPLSSAVAESIIARMHKGDHVLIAVCTHGPHSAIMDSRVARSMSQVNSLKGPTSDSGMAADGASSVMSRKALRKAKKAAKDDARAAGKATSKAKKKGKGSAQQGGAAAAPTADMAA